LVVYFLAGGLNQLYGWRNMFVMLGLPGLIPAAIALVTLREPRRDRAAVQQPVTPQFSFAHVLATLWGNTTFRHLLLCFAAMNFFGSGISQWQPAFLMRSFGLKTGELGSWFSVIYGVGGLLGTYLGGELATRHAAGNERLQLRAMALAYVVFGLVSGLIYLSPNRFVAFALIAVAAIGGATTNGPLFATIQTLVPPKMRATSIAGIYFFANLIGAGLGPLVAGALSDAMSSRYGPESLRYALLALTPGYFWGAWHVWRASRTVTRDLAYINPHQGRI